MFQDDRMIPVLSAVVLMVTVGMFLQRIDAVDRLLGGEVPPAVVLHDDEIAVAGNKLLRIDVFANDENIDESARAGLKIVSGPSCGRLFVRSGELEYVPELGCEGRETIRYSFEGAEPDQVATVVATIEGVREDATGTKSPPRIVHAAPPEGSAGNASTVAARTDVRLPAGPSTGREVAAASLPASEAAEAPDRAVAALPSSRGAAHDAGSTEAADLPHDSPAAEPSHLPAPADPSALAISEPPDPARPAHEAGPAVTGMDLASGAAPLASGREAFSEKIARQAASTPLDIARRTTASPEVEITPGTSSSPEPELSLAAVRPEGVAARRLSTPPSDPATRETSAGPVRADSSLSEGRASPLAGGGASPLAAGAGDDPATVETVTAERTASQAGRKPAPGPGRGSPEGELPGTEGERVAALSDPAGGAGAASPVDDAVAAGRAGPELSGTKVAVLVLPWDLDRASSPALVKPDEREGTGRNRPQRPLRGAVPDDERFVLWRPPAPRPAVFVGRSGPAPAGNDVSPRTAAAAADGPAFVLAIMGHDGAGPAFGPDLHGVRSAKMAAEAPEETGALLTALSPGLSPGLAVGPALDVLPVEPLSLPPGFEGLMVPRPRPADLGRRDPAAEPVMPAAEPADEPVVAEPAAPCTEVPGLTLDIRRVGVTVLGVAAPCQAGTVAELTYSGLRLAVPLDGNGQGSVTVPGFEPISPSIVTFRDGSELQFELPFLDVEQVSRVALAWDAPVELGLNALEDGAALNSLGHVRPGAARSLEEARQTGGGYLSVFWPVAGVGQSVQVYSWHHQSGESPGVVRMMVDFVSRDRDRLASACGNGRDAAPSFVVLRSEAGRLEEPVVRRLDPIDCGRIPEADGSGRLISGVVDDLLITR